MTGAQRLADAEGREAVTVRNQRKRPVQQLHLDRVDAAGPARRVDRLQLIALRRARQDRQRLVVGEGRRAAGIDDRRPRRHLTAQVGDVGHVDLDRGRADAGLHEGRVRLHRCDLDELVDHVQPGAGFRRDIAHHVGTGGHDLRLQ